MNNVAGFALVSAVALTGAKAPPPPVLAHSGPWDVHSSENACMLARTFGNGEQTTLVAFQPLFESEYGELFVMTSDEHSGQRTGEARITQEPSGTIVKSHYYSVRLPKEAKRVTRMTVPKAVWTGLATTDVLTISAPPVSRRVKIVRFNAAKPVFDKCERDTLKGWSVDPTSLDPDHAPKPMREPGFYFSSDDYPKSAMAMGHVGRVVAILDIDVNGAVAGCRIGSSSWPDLNDVTCRQGRRVRFTPAHDAVGKAIPGIFLLPVRWSMPGDY